MVAKLSFSVNSQAKRDLLHFIKTGRQRSGQERKLSGGSEEVQRMSGIKT